MKLPCDERRVGQEKLMMLESYANSNARLYFERYSALAWLVSPIGRLASPLFGGAHDVLSKKPGEKRDTA
jgi:hypothetical protein